MAERTLSITFQVLKVGCWASIHRSVHRLHRAFAFRAAKRNIALWNLQAQRFDYLSQCVCQIDPNETRFDFWHRFLLFTRKLWDWNFSGSMTKIARPAVYALTSPVALRALC
jgi:hypothetical protein